MDYQQEKYDDVIEEATPLLEKHWKEIALNRDKVPLNPDHDKYRSLEDMDLLKIYTARSKGVLKGYFVVLVSPHLHYKDTIYAMNDLIYVDPSKRGGIIAYRLIQFAEQELKAEGVDVLVINMKTSLPFDKLLLGLDFKYVERIYSKYIGE